MSALSRKFILVASASEADRGKVSSILQQNGYEVALAVSGADVMSYIRGRRPDVALIHEGLLESSGADVVAALKADVDDPVTVVLMRPAAGGDGARRPLCSNVDDVVGLPPDPSELTIRVQKALELSLLKRLLQDDALRIKELEQARDELTRLIVRDMKAPLTGLADLLEMADSASVRHFKTDASQYINEALDATETLEEMVSFLLDVRHMLAGEKTLKRRRCDLTKMVRGISGILGEAAQAAGVTVEVVGAPVVIACDEGVMSQVLRHLLRTAILTCLKGRVVRAEVTEDSEGGRVVVFCVGVDGEADRSYGLADMLRPGGVAALSGLGSTFCRLAVESHGGKYGVEANRGGTSWWLTLPVGTGMDVSGKEETEGESLPSIFSQRSRRYLGGNESKIKNDSAVNTETPRTTRYQFAVAVAIMSAIPLLAFGYLLADALLEGALSLQTMYLMIPAIVALVSLGIVVLMRHTMEMSRLRQYLEVIARGGAPQGDRWVANADFEAMGKSLDTVMAQASEKVRIIEAQSKALVHSEQQRVMVETVGAACHHLGQPATVISVYLDLMKKKESSPEMQRLITECQLAATDVSGILHRLQNVTMYQTEPYLLTGDPGVKRSDERILKI